MKKFNYIFICGDIHGKLNIIPDFIKKHGLDNCAVIVAGDFGIGFESKRSELRRMEYLNKRLRHSNSVIYGVRGNHDNPMYFTGEYDMDNVKLIPDYSILELNDYRILCVGGALSIDRTNRKSYFRPNDLITVNGDININDYWKDENFVFDYNKTDDSKDIDVVITHSAPYFAYPYVKDNLYSWAESDETIVKEVEQERRDIAYLHGGLVNNGSKIKKWFYGHFHQSNKLPYKDTDFIGLNINEMFELK
jgi:predicted phosphodiesterase